MMQPIFVDTSALIALGNQRDLFHAKAHEVKKNYVKAKRRFITTSLVIVEFCNTFSNCKFRKTAIEMVETIYQSDKWIYINVDKDLMDKGFELFKRMEDKEWGLVDCISIIVAENFGLSEIFSNDSHFEQASFQILLK